MRKMQTTTYTLRRRRLPNLRVGGVESSVSPGTKPIAAGALRDYKRQRLNFEQRRLEHLRERWRAGRGNGPW